MHVHRRIDSSSSRSDPSANGYIDLDYSARLHLALQRRGTAAVDYFNYFNTFWHILRQQRVRLLRLREDDRQLADDYINYSFRLEN
jgi:hypothetical protein